MVVVFFCSFMQLSSYPSNHNQNAHFFLSPSHTFSILLQFLSFLPFFLFSLSLFSGTIRCSKLVLYFSASLTYLPISLKNHSFFPWDSIQKPDSGCYLRKLSFKKQYMQMELEMHSFKVIYIYLFSRNSFVWNIR